MAGATLTAVAQDATTGKTASKTAAFSVGTRGAFGSTVRVPAGTYAGCNGGLLDPCSNLGFDTAASTGLATKLSVARRIQKVYLMDQTSTAPAELPATPPQAWINFVNGGGKLIISFRPSQTFGVDEQRFQACVAGCAKNLGSNWKGILFQEPNVASHGFTATTYQAYVANYAPYFRAAAPGITLAFNPAVCGSGAACNVTSAVNYCPAATYVDEIYADFYQTAFHDGGRLAPLAQVADSLGVPFGVAEWGPAAGSPPSWTFDQTQWDAYCDYLYSFFTGRLQAGSDNAWIIWWSGNVGTGSDIDWITSSSSPYIPQFQRLYKALAAA